MARHYIFADESGNFDFSRAPGASKYFSVGTILLPGDNAVEALQRDLLKLQVDLGWQNVGSEGAFHASEDRQAVRDEVFKVLQRHTFRADVTLLEKSKAQPHTRVDDPTFFQYAWYYHFKYLAPIVTGKDDELMVTASAVGTKKLRGAFRAAVESVVQQCAWQVSPRLRFVPAETDPCLQAADYMLWAVMRWWNGGDDRALVPVRSKVRTQFDLFEWGKKHWY
jgi:hypothetical protein